MPKDRYALHSCDNPRCVNPSHLRWGTAADNTNDAVTRKRLPELPSIDSNPEWRAKAIAAVPRGETHYKAKFTTADVDRVREHHRITGLGPTPLSKVLGYPHYFVYGIITGRARKAG